MTKARLVVPRGALELPIEQRVALIKGLADELGVDDLHPLAITSHNEERDMWTRDEVPMIADLEDWFYGELVKPITALMNDLMAGLFGTETHATPLLKSFGDDFTDWLEKSNDDQGGRGSFKLSDLIKMNQKTQENLIKYVADGGVYTPEQIKRLQDFLAQRIPNYDPLLTAYSVRSILMGKLKNAADLNHLQLVGTLINTLPVRIEQVTKRIDPVILQDPDGKRHVVQMHPFTKAEIEAARFAEQHAAQYVTFATVKLKTGIQEVITNARRNRLDAAETRQRLFDKFSEYNRDFRRIALTELTDAMANGYLASLPEGAQVMGQGAANACPHCKRLIIGKKFTVAKQPGDPDNVVWVGKTNVGLKTKEWQPTIPMHPHCRCRWVQLADFQDVSPEGVAYIKPLEQLIQEYKERGLIHRDYDMDRGGPPGDYSKLS